MGKDHVAGHSLDNRTSIAAVTECLRTLQRMRHAFDVIAVGTIQEEVAHYSDTLINDLNPDIAIAIDVTFASGPGADDYRTRPLGSGPSIGFGANIHPALAKSFCDLAEEIDMPFTRDPLPNMSGTDARALRRDPERRAPRPRRPAPVAADRLGPGAPRCCRLLRRPLARPPRAVG